jgi:hypothetical protein
MKRPLLLPLLALAALAVLLALAMYGWRDRHDVALVERLAQSPVPAGAPAFEFLDSFSLCEVPPSVNLPEDERHVAFWKFDGADVVRLDKPRPTLLVSEGTEAERRTRAAIAELERALGASAPASGLSSDDLNLISGTLLDTFRMPVGYIDKYYSQRGAAIPLAAFGEAVRAIVEEAKAAGRYREWTPTALVDLSYYPLYRKRSPSFERVPSPLRGLFPDDNFVDLKDDAPWLRLAQTIVLVVRDLPFDIGRIVREPAEFRPVEIVLVREGTPTADAIHALLARHPISSFDDPGGGIRLVLDDGTGMTPVRQRLPARDIRDFAIELREILLRTDPHAESAENAEPAP